MEKIKQLLNKYRQILIYIGCSVFTCLLEAGIGYLLKNYLQYPLVIANTISIFLGAVVHYVLVSTKAFEKKMNAWNLFVYVATFTLGLLLQNLVIYVVYNKCLCMLGDDYEMLRYVCSKFISVAIPFFVIYYLRKYLYNKR